MNIVLNNPALYVVDYPSVDAIEVIDKRRARGGFFEGEAAQRFRRELHDAIARSEDEDELDFDANLEGFDALLTQPAVYQ